MPTCVGIHTPEVFILAKLSTFSFGSNIYIHNVLASYYDVCLTNYIVKVVLLRFFGGIN